MGKTNAQRIYIYNHGDGESSPLSAENCLYKMIGNDVRKWRFVVRKIPERNII
ncbi:MAG: hypothetical protein ACRC3H_16745 [Lachnospiraceae bacterium]